MYVFYLSSHIGFCLILLSVRIYSVAVSMNLGVLSFYRTKQHRHHHRYISLRSWSQDMLVIWENPHRTRLNLTKSRENLHSAVCTSTSRTVGSARARCAGTSRTVCLATGWTIACNPMCHTTIGTATGLIVSIAAAWAWASSFVVHIHGSQTWFRNRGGGQTRIR